MAFRKPKETPPPAAPALMASAVRMQLNEKNPWRGYRFADEAWQNQAWDFYDTNSQLHNAVDYIGAACSLVRVYVAHVDEYGVRQGEVDDDPDVAALSDTLFGGPAAKAEIQRALGESLTVAGECYLIGRSSTETNSYGDKWFVAAPSEVRRQGSKYTILVGHGVREELSPGRDAIVRVWTPHPRRPLVADSPVRACLQLLSHMAQLELTLQAQLSSRIANSVVWLVPDTLYVSKGDNEPTLADSIYEQILDVQTSNLDGQGTAAQIAPTMVPIPLAELAVMGQDKVIRFEGPLLEEAVNLRKEAMEKLAIGINVPVEIQMGGREMNHWGVWFAGEEFIVKTVMPIMGRIVDAMTTAFLYPALEKVLGKDPKRFTFWYDVAPLASSANQLIDTINLAKDGWVSASTVRKAANYNDSDAPSQQETEERKAFEIILRDPTLANVPEWRQAAGLNFDVAMPALDMSTPPPPPPAPESNAIEPPPGTKPLPQDTAGLTSESEEVRASVNYTSYPSPVHVAANSAVLRALELAGKRMLTPAIRKIYNTEPPTTLHTKLTISGGPQYCDTLLAGAWDYLPEQFEGTGIAAGKVRPVLDAYVKGLLLRSIKHDRSLLSAMLVEAGIR